MGKCKYILAKDFVNNTFEIMQENEPCGNGPPTCTKSLTVIFTNSTFIQLRRGMTLVNGSKVTLPVSYPGIYCTSYENFCVQWREYFNELKDKMLDFL